MDAVVSVFLPVSLGIIMLSLGLGLTVADFAGIVRQPRAVIAGLSAQVILLPVIVYSFVIAFGISGELAFGFMLLAASPGGVTSNILTKLVGGTLALSISLTGLISLLSVITVPLLVVFWAGLFLNAGDVTVDVTSLALKMFAITTVPVAIGMIIRAIAKDLALRIEPVLSVIAAVLFVVIVVGAIAASWSVLADNWATLAPMTALMVLCLLALGWVIARLVGLSAPDRAAIGMETGIQNSTVAITLAGILHAGPEALPVIALPAAVYGILMYLGALPGGYLMYRAVKRAP
ncbi:bile acid:sodium symporter family protein [Denitrobaculum tricleocarpae]|uniref:bile acid:sodium symporter family protein n=1 Tax=Denitrobaculum tricleocarpae TaxID=2591009 RepID=UPI0015D1ACAE|nr:bile acid:sodium symporter family protein [Denitrobaculum tricleocarpae]